MLKEYLTTEDGEKRMSTLTQAEIEMSAQIADRVEDIEIENKLHLPKYEFVPNIGTGCATKSCEHKDGEGETVDLTSFNYLVELVMSNYKTRYGVSIEEASEEHKARVKKELRDIKSAGLADYFLIIWDIVNWARSQRIPVGPGRGCLTDNSYVFTLDGYKKISDIIPNYDKVINENGDIVKVLNKVNFAIDEDVLEVKCYYDFWSSSEFTLDHKVLVKRGDKSTIYGKALHPSNKLNKWIRAYEINIGDYVCIPKFSKNYDIDRKSVSYWINSLDSLCELDGETIVEKTPNNKPFTLSVRDINKRFGISRNCLKNIIDNGFEKCHKGTIVKLNNAIKSSSIKGVCSIEDWIIYIKNQKFNYSYIPKNIPINRDYAKLVGLWIGDGCYKKTSGISIFLNPSDIDALSFLRKYLKDLGIRYRECLPKDKKALITFDIQSRIIYRMFNQIFGKVYSSSKFIPDSFMYNRELLEGVLVCLIWSDGSLSEGRISFDTISERLMNNVRTLSYILDTPTSVYKRVYGEKSNEKDAYKIRFARSNTIIRLFDINTPSHNFYFEDDNFMYCAIREINKRKFSGDVYDLAVDGDSSSFLAGGFTVHNSASGSIVSYILKITGIDPIKYGLIWERFYNVGRKESMADIDIDVSRARRGEVVKYIEDRFGKDRVAQMVTFNTLATKAALKDTAKILGKSGMSSQDANVMNRNVMHKVKNLADAVEKNNKLKEYEEKNPRLFKIAGKLEGCPKSSGQHPAGIIISDESFETGCIPLRWNAKEKKLITEWDGVTLDSMGYLKVDILGLNTMDVLDNIQEDVNRRFYEEKRRKANDG
jgi:hypothetical protein